MIIKETQSMWIDNYFSPNLCVWPAKLVLSWKGSPNWSRLGKSIFAVPQCGYYLNHLNDDAAAADHHPTADGRRESEGGASESREAQQVELVVQGVLYTLVGCRHIRHCYQLFSTRCSLLAMDTTTQVKCWSRRLAKSAKVNEHHRSWIVWVNHVSFLSGQTESVSLLVSWLSKLNCRNY